MVDVESETSPRVHDGRTMSVRRVVASSAGYDTKMEYEFELLVDGEVETTATELEEDGYEYPWTAALFEYGEAAIDRGEI
jgi:hypothetical protein